MLTHMVKHPHVEGKIKPKCLWLLWADSCGCTDKTVLGACMFLVCCIKEVKDTDARGWTCTAVHTANTLSHKCLCCSLWCLKHRKLCVPRHEWCWAPLLFGTVVEEHTLQDSKPTFITHFKSHQDTHLYLYPHSQLLCTLPAPSLLLTLSSLSHLFSSVA